MRIQELVIDCQDPRRVAEFWSALLGVPWAPVHDGWAVLDTPGLRIGFQRVPERKQSRKNRLHLDVEVADARAGLARAGALGAVPTGQRELDTHGDGYVVLQDPEGNELCLVVDRAGGWDGAQRRALDAAPRPRRAWHIARAADVEAVLARAQEQGARGGDRAPGLRVDDASVGVIALCTRDRLDAVASAWREGGDGDLVAIEIDLDVAASWVRADDGGVTDRPVALDGPLRAEWVVDVVPVV